MSADTMRAQGRTFRGRQRTFRTSRSAAAQVSTLSKALTFGVLLLGALYFLLPVWWLIVSATKSNSGLFASNGFWFADFQLFDNIATVFTAGGGQYGRWLLNSAIYSGIGGLGATLLGAACGYTIAKLSFPGRGALFALIMSGVLIPGALLTVPLYLMFSAVGLVGTYWAVLIPSIVSPFAVYLARVYAIDSVPDDVIEAARVDGAGEVRIFFQIVLPMMGPALVTILLFTFVGIWNNFFLAMVMLTDQSMYPVTLGLYQWFSNKSQATYDIVITGSLISVIPLVIAFLSLSRFWKSGITTGALKG